MKFHSNHHLHYKETAMTFVSKVTESSSPISVVDVSSFPVPDIAFIFGHDSVHTIGHNEFALNVAMCIIGHGVR